MYTFIHIKTFYGENRCSAWKLYENIESAMPEIENQMTSSFEVLRNDLQRIYLDIENVPNEESSMIYKIIECFSEFINIDKEVVCFTKNEHSSNHFGLSYHVVFPYYMEYLLIKRLVCMFKQEYPEYENYIDSSVYTPNRIFRLPNQYGVKAELSRELDKNSIHIIQKGNFEDFVIQNIESIQELPKENLPKGFNSFVVFEKHTRNNSGGNRQRIARVMTENEELKKHVQELETKIQEMSNYQLKQDELNDWIFKKIMELGNIQK